jgi:TM2 domain-containing membrane protein YozV
MRVAMTTENITKAINAQSASELHFRANEKSTLAAYLLYFFFGGIGVHLLYTRSAVRFILHWLLITLGLYAWNDAKHGGANAEGARGIAIICLAVFVLLSLWDLLFSWCRVQKCNERTARRLLNKYR